MRVLALETSGRVGSIALVEAIGREATVLQERRLPAGQRTARTLLPAIDEMLRDQAWPPATLALIATTTGPGSFTGLRIGVVAAKTLAYATGARLVGVHTLAAIAEDAFKFMGDLWPARLWTVLDAQRHELFVANFEPGGLAVGQAQPATEIVAIDDWLARLGPNDAVSGPPLAKLRDRLPDAIAVLPERLWQPSAAATGRIAARLLQNGVTTPPLELVPHYYRKSAAEEKANI